MPTQVLTVPDALRYMAQTIDDGDFIGVAAVVLERDGVAQVCAFDDSRGAAVRAMLIAVGEMLTVRGTEQ